jgi:hypothetical protein
VYVFKTSSRLAKTAPWGDEQSSPKEETEPEGSKESDWQYTRLVPGAKMEIPDRIDAALDAKMEILAALEVHLC